MDFFRLCMAFECCIIKSFCTICARGIIHHKGEKGERIIMTKKILAIFLALVMCLSLLPLAALADEDVIEDVIEDVLADAVPDVEDVAEAEILAEDEPAPVTDGETWTVSVWGGSTTATVRPSITAARDGQLYKCVITDAYGSTVESAAAAIRLMAG